MIAEMLEQLHEVEPQPVQPIEPLLESRRCGYCPEILNYIVAPNEDEGEAQERAVESQGWGTIGRELACDRCLALRERED